MIVMAAWFVLSYDVGTFVSPLRHDGKFGGNFFQTMELMPAEAKRSIDIQESETRIHV